MWQTAINPVIALELLASGAWSGAGVLGPGGVRAAPVPGPPERLRLALGDRGAHGAAASRPDRVAAAQRSLMSRRRHRPMTMSMTSRPRVRDPLRSSPRRGSRDVLTPGSLLEATPESLVVAETDGEIVYANAACERLTGLRARRAPRAAGRSALLADRPRRASAAGTSFETTCTRRRRRRAPRRGPRRQDRGRRRLLLVVTLRDRTELRGRPRGAFRGRGQVPGARRAHPRGRLPRPRGRGLRLDLREPAGRELLGISQDEWLTDPYAWRHHVHPEDIDRAWDEYRDAYNAHEPLEPRVPDGPRGRHGQVGPRAGLPIDDEPASPG